jgi:hypothetical protein
MIAPIIIITAVLMVFNPGNRKESSIPAVSIVNEVQKNEEVVNKPGAVNQNIFRNQPGKSKLSGQSLNDGVSEKEPSDSILNPGVIEGMVQKGQNDTIREPQNILNLETSVFKCMGFYFDHGEYIFFTRIGKDWFRYGWPVPAGDMSHPGKEPFQSVMKANLPFESGFSGKSVPILAMQHSLKFTFAMVYEIWQKDSIDGLLFNEALQLCLPLRINDPSLSKKTQEDIFWIYPNESFFECLPAEIAGPIRREFNYQRKRMDPDFVPMMGGSIGIKGGGLMKDTLRMGGSIGIGGGEIKSDDSSGDSGMVPCVYFTNLCESLPGLDYVNLYPNPVSDRLNVDLVLEQGKKILFRVYDLGGRIISDEGKPEVFGEGGQYRHQLDVSQLQGGLYLLVMTDEEGARLTRRFVKN